MTTPEALNRLNQFDIILASKSPRRQQLLTGIGVKYRIAADIETEEVFPAILKREEIPLYLAQAKAMSYKSLINKDTLLITADTIVWHGNEVIGKPSGFDEAVEMLKKLSGNMHEVFTGVCVKSFYSEKLFYACSKVFFRKVNDDEILYYINTYKPYDKAGAYGVQEWIGYIAVERIEGSFYNVMGLPIQQLYCELLKIIEQ